MEICHANYYKFLNEGGQIAIAPEDVLFYECSLLRQAACRELVCPKRNERQPIAAIPYKSLERPAKW